MNTLLLSTLKMLLLCIFKFGPTAQFVSKTLKFETPILLFWSTHTRVLLIDHSNCFFPPILNQENEAVRSPNKMMYFSWMFIDIIIFEYYISINTFCLFIEFIFTQYFLYTFHFSQCYFWDLTTRRYNTTNKPLFWW